MKNLLTRWATAEAARIFNDEQRAEHEFWKVGFEHGYLQAISDLSDLAAIQPSTLVGDATRALMRITGVSKDRAA